MSALPTRRTTRSATSSARKLENAHANGRSTATKPPPPARTSSKDAETSTAKVTTRSATARRKENGVCASITKRKRNALLDASSPPQTRAASASSSRAPKPIAHTGAASAKQKGKLAEKCSEDETDAVALKKTVTAKASTTRRQALRTLSGPAQSAPTVRQTRRSTIVKELKVSRDVLADVKEEEEEREAETEVTEQQRVSSPDTRVQADSPVKYPGRSTRRSIATTVVLTAKREVPQRLTYKSDDEEDGHISKKRRTSSEADESDEDKENVHVSTEPDPEPEAEQEHVEEHVEAEPDLQDWDDLDAEDKDDEAAVSEYVHEVFEYLRESEQTTMPDPNYLERQSELQPAMRGILNDWLIKVQLRYRLLPETLFLAVNIIDRFLSIRMVSVVKLQLVGITALFIASKFEEVIAPAASNFLHDADDGYTEAEILQAEKYILRTLDWKLAFANPMNFLRRANKAEFGDFNSRTLAKYFLEISVVERHLLAMPPSLLAAAALWLARLVVNQEEWTPNLVHYSCYAEDALIPTAVIMLRYVQQPITYENFERKYSARRFLKASLLVRKWFLENLRSGDLVQELPRIRAIGRARAAERARIEQEAAEAGSEPESSVRTLRDRSHPARA